MWNQLVDRLKRIVLLLLFFGGALWLTWCGERYEDNHNSTLPALMCAVEAIVLILTGAAIMAERSEPEMRE